MMPIFYQQDIDEVTKLGIWRIEEDEEFFNVPLQRTITHPHKRLQHLAGRYLLRYLFADFPLELIKIADTRKPYLEDEAYHFSISHCGNYAAVIVSKNKRVGVDIEVPNDKVERIMEKFLHPEEIEHFNTLNSSLENNSTFSIQHLALTLLWCCKEAVFKWWSYGSVDFSEMIRLESTQLHQEGNIKGTFRNDSVNKNLKLNYKFFEQLCLAWLVSESPL